MPLEVYKRGKWWWIKGRIDEIPGCGYYRQSLEIPSALPEAKAEEIKKRFEQKAIKRNLIEEYTGEEIGLTFSDAILLYTPKPAEANYLSKILPHLGDDYLKKITPLQIKELGKVVYPEASTDTWHRQVVSPVRSVINHAHELGKCPPIRVKAYSDKQRVEQDRLRGKKSRIPKIPADMDWLMKFRAEASPRIGALAMFMYTAGRRIGQSLSINDSGDLSRLNENLVYCPGAKGHEDEWIELIPELTAELMSLETRHGRLFGFKQRHHLYGSWKRACERAKILPIMPHAAGRHGFGTEVVVRLGIDPATGADAGGWKDPQILLNTYSHAEDSRKIVNQAIRTKLVHAMRRHNDSALKLLKKKAM